MNREYREKISKEVKEIHFLDVERFSELFDEWRFWIRGKSKGFASIPWKTPHAKGCEIGDYCSALRTDIEGSLHVRPNDKVIEFIKSHMIPVDYDSLYFELVTRKDGILVSVKYNAILGSRWLALLPLEALEEIRSGAATVLKDANAMASLSR